MYKLGAGYMGSFQCLSSRSYRSSAPLVAEEKFVLGLHAACTSQSTLAGLRKHYSNTDLRSLGRILGVSTHENATPIRFLHNCTWHLMGPARPLGGVLIGYLGIR